MGFYKNPSVSRHPVPSSYPVASRSPATRAMHSLGQYLLGYAQGASWLEDDRRISNGDQVNMISGQAMKRGPSVDFSGYWQRHAMG